MARHQAHEARIFWERLPGERFLDARYSRAHRWEFDGGMVVPASSAVQSVPLPYSKAENVDPEEAFVAAISACHMLTFLYRAATAGFIVDSYEDSAVGTMSRDAGGRLGVSAVVLAPRVDFSGSQAPNDEIVARLHAEAHAECYIANSVRTDIRIEGAWTYRAASRKE